MASWEFPDNESSLLHAAKFAPDLKSQEHAAEHGGEALLAALTGQEEIAGARGAEALEELATMTGSMDLWFQNGRVYTFFEVPYAVYRGLLSASSPGSFYNSNIRGNYAG
jgi:hypothetical protein